MMMQAGAVLATGPARKPTGPQRGEDAQNKKPGPTTGPRSQSVEPFRRQVPLANRKSACDTCYANADGWNGLPAQASPLQERDGGMENFLLFILSSSVCTLVASVTLLLRPLVGLP